jgi:hypothetical protein
MDSYIDRIRVTKEKYDAVKEKINTAFKDRPDGKKTALKSLTDIKNIIEDRMKDIQNMYIVEIFNFFEEYRKQIGEEMLDGLLKQTGYNKEDLKGMSVKIHNKVNGPSNFGRGNYPRNTSSPFSKSGVTAIRKGIIGGLAINDENRYGNYSPPEPGTPIPKYEIPEKTLDFYIDKLKSSFNDLIILTIYLMNLYYASLTACDLILERMNEPTTVKKIIGDRFSHLAIDYSKANKRIQNVLDGVLKLSKDVVNSYYSSLSDRPTCEKLTGCPSTLNPYNGWQTQGLQDPERYQGLAWSNQNQNFYNEKFFTKFFEQNLSENPPIDDQKKFQKFLKMGFPISYFEFFITTKIWINNLIDNLEKFKGGQSDQILLLELIQQLKERSKRGGRRKMVRSTKKNNKLKTKKKLKSRKIRKSMRHKRR